MRTVLKAAALYFLAVFGAGFLLGIARTLWVAPHIGERAAELVETPLVLCFALIVVRHLVRRMAVPGDASHRLALGAVALALLFAAERLLVLPLTGRPLGIVHAAALAVFALLPLLARKRFLRTRRVDAYHTAPLV